MYAFIFIVLGGAYVVNNALWKHELVRHPWEYKPRNSIKCYCTINVPETIICTFNSSLTGYLPNSGYPPIVTSLFSFINQALKLIRHTVSYMSFIFSRN